jgi:hypothetical protein
MNERRIWEATAAGWPMEVIQEFYASAADEAEVLGEVLVAARRGLYLWRGVTISSRDNRNRSGVETTHRVRHPRSMPLHLSEACDGWFERRFGWRARSNHALFLSGSRHQALEFGVPVLVLPMQPARFLWSPQIRDLTRHLEALGVATSGAVEEVLDAGDYRDTGLEAAIRSGNEIMFRCEQYRWILPDR